MTQPNREVKSPEHPVWEKLTFHIPSHPTIYIPIGSSDVRIFGPRALPCSLFTPHPLESHIERKPPPTCCLISCEAKGASGGVSTPLASQLIRQQMGAVFF